MTSDEWEELETILETEGFSEDRYRYLLGETLQEEEHPEDYDGPCLCGLCLGYGD